MLVVDRFGGAVHHQPFWGLVIPGEKQGAKTLDNGHVSSLGSTAPRPADRTARLNALLTAVGSGDAESFSALYDELSPAVYGTALRVVRDADYAADVTQEVMVEVWRTAPSFDGNLGTAAAWVSTMAHRRAVDRVRSVQAQRNRDQEHLDRSNETPWDSVAETAETRSEREAVFDCMGTLTNAQRDAVAQTYYQGLSYREAAEQSNVGLPAMKSRIRDALIRLRQCLEGGS